jgi:hypothetical protein
VECQLSEVYDSLAGEMSRQWIETVSHKIKDYQSFRELFLDTWWSAKTQNIVKCNLYQRIYNRQSGLSLSAHFLKYANGATYFNPRASEVELIEAINSHFPHSVQRTMVNNKLDSIEETLDLLKRIKRIEELEICNRDTDINNGKREY